MSKILKFQNQARYLLLTKNHNQDYERKHENSDWTKEPLRPGKNQRQRKAPIKSTFFQPVTPGDLVTHKENSLEETPPEPPLTSPNVMERLIPRQERLEGIHVPHFEFILPAEEYSSYFRRFSKLKLLGFSSCSGKDMLMLKISQNLPILLEFLRLQVTVCSLPLQNLFSWFLSARIHSSGLSSCLFLLIT